MTDMIAKDGVEAETVAAVKSLSGKYKYGFSTREECGACGVGVSWGCFRGGVCGHKCAGASLYGHGYAYHPSLCGAFPRSLDALARLWRFSPL